MGRLNYSLTPAGRSSRAMGMELHISPKHAREICRTLRGMRANLARAYLEDVIALKRAIPFKTLPKKCGPQARPGGLGCRQISGEGSQGSLDVLDNALANAEYKGMESDKMRIFHAGTKKGRTIQGWMPRAMGRATPKNTETVSVEMVLTEVKS